MLEQESTYNCLLIRIKVRFKDSTTSTNDFLGRALRSRLKKAEEKGWMQWSCFVSLPKENNRAWLTTLEYRLLFMYTE